MFDRGLCFTFTESLGTEADFYQAITGDAASANLIDLDVANLNIAAGRPLYLVVKVGSAFVTLTSLEIALETDTAVGFATAKKQVMINNVALASLTAGAVVVNQALPVQKYQRYMRVYFNVVGSNPGSGSTICAYLTDSPEEAMSQLDLVGA